MEGSITLPEEIFSKLLAKSEIKFKIERKGREWVTTCCEYYGHILLDVAVEYGFRYEPTSEEEHPSPLRFEVKRTFEPENGKVRLPMLADAVRDIKYIDGDTSPIILELGFRRFTGKKLIYLFTLPNWYVITNKPISATYIHVPQSRKQKIVDTISESKGLLADGLVYKDGLVYLPEELGSVFAMQTSNTGEWKLS